MPDKEKTCTVGGTHVCKPSAGFNLPELLIRIEDEIRAAIRLGYDTFYSGMDIGADIWAAETVLKLKPEYPGIRLFCCLPCETQAERWPNCWREKYYDTLAEADEVVCLQTRQSEGCMRRRSLTMIGNSSRLIAVHTGSSAGRTAEMLRYATAQGITVRTVDFCVEHQHGGAGEDSVCIYGCFF